MDRGRISLAQLKEQKEKAAAELQAMWKEAGENQKKRMDLRRELVDLQRDLRIISANGATDLEVLQDFSTERENIQADKENMTADNNAYTFDTMDYLEGSSQEIIAKSDQIMELIRQFPCIKSVSEELEGLEGMTTELQYQLDNLCASVELMAAALKTEQGASLVVDIALEDAVVLKGNFDI